ncbi:hypothetical protein QWZ13_14940 [Reinekea marina]|nr:hypothetical protein [Reinekea marina]MDN3650213.1 hypothetical protein [Reinekea marina]
MHGITYCIAKIAIAVIWHCVLAFLAFVKIVVLFKLEQPDVC